MAAKSKKMVIVPKTERRHGPEAHVVGLADPGHRITVTVYLRRNPHAKPVTALEAMDSQLPKDRKYLSNAEVEANFGADPADIAKVEAYARASGLIVLESHVERRSVMLSGTVDQFNTAFGVQLKQFETPTEHYRGQEGPVHVPTELDGIVVGVFGLENRRVGKPHFRRQTAPRRLRRRAPGQHIFPSRARDDL